MSVNKVILVGNLGKDPESRTFDNGGKVVNLSLATSKQWTDDKGEKHEKTQWHTVAIFNKAKAEVAERYLKKGSKVYLEGELEYRTFEGKDGKTHYVAEVVLPQYGGDLQLLDKKEPNRPAEKPAATPQPEPRGRR